jgi:hypothetical protein
MLMRLPKRTTDAETAFNDWWAAQSKEFKGSHDKDDLQRGFKAGFAAGRRKKVRRFTFMVGKMRVTVWAANQGTAKALASQEADRRAAAVGVSPPRAGWTLRLVASAGP